MCRIGSMGMNEFETWFDVNMDETEPKEMCHKTWMRQQFIIDDLQKKIDELSYSKFIKEKTIEQQEALIKFQSELLGLLK